MAQVSVGGGCGTRPSVRQEKLPMTEAELIAQDVQRLERNQEIERRQEWQQKCETMNVVGTVLDATGMYMGKFPPDHTKIEKNFMIIKKVLEYPAEPVYALHDKHDKYMLKATFRYPSQIAINQGGVPKRVRVVGWSVSRKSVQMDVIEWM